jgi:putative oxidoreductase
MFIRSLVRAPWLMLVARILLSLVFVVSGFEKLQNFQQTLTTIGSLTTPGLALLFTVLAIVFELGGGLMLLINWKTELALNMLVVFIVLATVLVHGNLSDPALAQKNLIQIEKNLAIIGGLLLLGRLSFLEQEMA